MKLYSDLGTSLQTYVQRFPWIDLTDNGIQALRRNVRGILEGSVYKGCYLVSYIKKSRQKIELWPKQFGMAISAPWVSPETLDELLALLKREAESFQADGCFLVRSHLQETGKEQKLFVLFGRTLSPSEIQAKRLYPGNGLSKFQAPVLCPLLEIEKTDGGFQLKNPQYTEGDCYVQICN